MDYAQQIKQMLSTRDVFERYGYMPNFAGMVSCPFHAEEKASMKVYDGDKGYFCFGCKAHGDIFDFVKNLFNISFNEAVQKLNDDFALGLPIGEKIPFQKQLQMAKEAYKRKRELERKKEDREKALAEYWKAFDAWARLELNKKLFAPKTEDEEFSPLFIEAVMGVEQAKDELYLAEVIRYEREHRNN